MKAINIAMELEKLSKKMLAQQKEGQSVHTTTKCKYGCDGSGVIILSNDTACQCKCVEDNYKKKKAEKLLAFASIPDDLKDLSIDDYEIDIYEFEESRIAAKQVKIAVENFIDNYELFSEAGKGLYFYSRTPGSGKSTMAVAIANKLLSERNISIRYTTMAELLSEIKATYNNNSETNESELIEAVQEVEVLILDEIGIEKGSSWVEEIFYRILNNRLNNNKIIIFTSNLLISELDYSHRVKSRISKLTEIIAFPEEDVRLKLSHRESDKFKKILMGGSFDV